MYKIYIHYEDMSRKSKRQSSCHKQQRWENIELTATEGRSNSWGVKFYTTSSISCCFWESNTKYATSKTTSVSWLSLEVITFLLQKLLIFTALDKMHARTNCCASQLFQSPFMKLESEVKLDLNGPLVSEHQRANAPQ